MPNDDLHGLRALLIVEDDQDSLELIVEAFRGKGFGVLAATDAEQGLAHLRRGGVVAIVTDFMLGLGATGCWMLAVAGSEGLLRGVRAIVICTGSPDVQAPRGLDAVVTRKPIDLAAIDSLIAPAFSA